jgi:hypothetical protein
MKEEKKFQILSAEVSAKYNCHIEYILVKCVECYRTFGVTPDLDNCIPIEKLTCFQCTSKKYNALVESMA